MTNITSLPDVPRSCVVVTKCQEGYIMESGDSIRSYCVSGEWTPALSTPKCLSK